MNPQRLLQHFDTVSEAPDAVTKLRRFILDLAVRGKLMEQNAEDEPASDLLKRIAKEKVQFVKAGDLRRPRELNDGGAIEEPFPIPSTWQWVRLDGIGAIIGGGTPSATDATNFAAPSEGIPWLTPADLGGYSKLFISRGARDLSEKGSRSSAATVMPAGTVLFTSRAPIGYVAIAANPISTNQGFKSIVPYVGDCSRFIATAMKTFAPEINAKAPGTTFKEVSGKIVAAIPIPLPPLAEQLRIVTKVEELMALCDQLQAARDAREQQRDRLVTASLRRLTADGTEPAARRADQACFFHLRHLPRLTTRLEYVKQLRKAILDLAICGRLVQQDANEESATQLLERIRQCTPSGRKRHAHKITTASKFPSCFGELPEGWSAATFGDLIHHSDAGWSPKTENFARSGDAWGVIKVSAVSWNTFNPDANKQLLPGASPPKSAVINRGDFLISRANTSELVAKCVIVSQQPEKLILSDKIVRLHLSDLCDKRFFQIVNNDAGYAREHYAKRATGVSPSMKNVSRSVIYELFVPVPPLAEQHRIVAKVDELMLLCDQLEASLNATRDDQCRLLNTLLHEALQQNAPSSERAQLRVNWPMRRAAVSCYIVSRMAPKRAFGRVAHMKHAYLAEAHLGLALGGTYGRRAAGPLDDWIYDVEAQAANAGWFSTKTETLPAGKEKVSYQPGANIDAMVNDAVAILGDQRSELDRIINLMNDMTTEEVEIVATLFAVWNDALIDGLSPDDDWVIREVRENWHASKQRFDASLLRKWVGWMRANSLVPTGKSPRTIQQTSLGL